MSREIAARRWRVGHEVVVGRRARRAPGRGSRRCRRPCRPDARSRRNFRVARRQRPVAAVHAAILRRDAGVVVQHRAPDGGENLRFHDPAADQQYDLGIEALDRLQESLGVDRVDLGDRCSGFGSSSSPFFCDDALDAFAANRFLPSRTSTMVANWPAVANQPILRARRFRNSHSRLRLFEDHIDRAELLAERVDDDPGIGPARRDDADAGRRSTLARHWTASPPDSSSRIGQSGRSSPWQAWTRCCSVLRSPISSAILRSISTSLASAIAFTSALSRALSP